MRYPIAAIAFGALSLAAAVLTAASPRTPAVPDRHSVIINGLRYDDEFKQVVAAGRLFDDLHRREASARPFSISLLRVNGRLIWRILAAQGARVYTMRGRYASPIVAYTFDAKNGRLLSGDIARGLREPPGLPNRTPMPQNGATTTPCPMRPPGTQPPPIGFYYATAPPNAIPGQNYSCLRPLPGTSPWHRPTANATSSLDQFATLKDFYESAYARARASNAFVVEIELLPFGSAQKIVQPDVFGYDTEAARMMLLSTVIAPHGLNAGPCYFDYVVVTAMTDAATQSGGGASMRGRCRPGTYGPPPRRVP